MFIEDGKGKGNVAEVNSRNQISVAAMTNRRSFFVSRDDGQTFNLVSHDASAAAGTYICYWKNDSTTKSLFFDLVRVGAVETVLWKVWFVTGTAAGGSALTPVNMNRILNNTADATCRGNDSITGLSTDGQIATIRTAANTTSDIPFDTTVIIGNGQAVAVEYDTGTTGIAEVLMRAYYE